MRLRQTGFIKRLLVLGVAVAAPAVLVAALLLPGAASASGTHAHDPDFSRIASWLPSGTHTAVSSLARSSLAKPTASRRLVFTLSPGRFGISEGATTTHS